MKQSDFHQQEEILSPAKEAEYRSKIARLEVDLARREAELARKEAEFAAELSRKDAIIAQMQKALYGQKSEKTAYVLDDGRQLSLFDEAEQEEDKSLRQKETAVVVGTHKRKPKRTHEEMAKDLPQEEVVHQREKQDCDQCGEDLNIIGKEFVRDEVIYVPAHLYIRKHYVEVLKCPSCGQDESKDKDLADVAAQQFFRGVAPQPMIPRSFCSPELLAHLAYEKYVKAVPLYRLEKDMEALGLALSRRTMANWIIYSSRQWLKPLWEEMKAELLLQRVIHADETVVQVLKEPGKKAQQESRMWVYCAGEIGSDSLILFEYQPNRKGENARAFLGDYQGYLISDGYTGYNKVAGAIRGACWSHVRRKFVDALPGTPEALKDSQAAIGVDYCNRLFALEKELAEAEPLERHKQRQEKAQPLLDKFFLWIQGLAPSGGSKLASAVGYALGQKVNLQTFMKDPLIPISNNRAENAIRPFVMGRKQWLFCDSVKGAQASAMYYSIAATACANGLNVERYFSELFRVLSRTTDKETLQRMLPMNWQKS